MLQQTTEDPGQPYLIGDLYPLDLDDPRTPQIEDPAFEPAFADPRLRGMILKAWDGTNYLPAYSDWFVRNFRALAELLGPDRGIGRFIGGYLYAQLLEDPEQQASCYLAQLQAAGWGSQDIVPIVDVEGGGERAANRKASRQQVIDCVSKISDWLHVRTGRGIMLYGRSLMRDLVVANKMGCDRVWNPSYTRLMITNGLVTINGVPGLWSLDDIVLWQYGGDGVGDASAHKLPLSLTGLGKVDVSVAVCGEATPTLAKVRSRLL